MAGARGSGKSTLTRRCRERGVSLFGEEYLTQLLQFESEYKKSIFDPTPLMQQKTWIRLKYAHLISEMRQLPDVLFLHIDLMSLFMMETRRYTELKHLATYQKYIDEADWFLRFIYRYERILVNTLYVPWEVAAYRHHQRVSVTKARVHPNVQRMYDTVNSEELTYLTFYKAWDHFKNRWGIQKEYRTELIPETMFSSVEVTNPSHSFVVRLCNDR